jgi:release factor glutamine methyltransferase
VVRTRFDSLSIIVPPGVYAPRSDTALLASELGVVKDAHVLELCAGSGALALLAAQRGAARVLAIDCSRRAVLAIRANARLNRLQLTARRGDLSSRIEPHERFDVILANPPYLPTIDEGRTDDRWDAGPDGRAVLDRIIDEASDHLRPEGRLVLAQSAVAGITATTKRLLANGLRVIHSIEHHGPYGPILTARRERLIDRGAMDARDSEETLVVLTASI